MTFDLDSTRVQSAVFLACSRVGLDTDQGRHTVKRWLNMPREEWPGCCAGSCAVCNLDVQTAVELTLEYLEQA
ncbi:MAG: hypothetical protein HRU17_06310 [Polyangiaceae bacterium]|nr:hypothetical protein [Polyangiaceae bacterium]